MNSKNEIHLKDFPENKLVIFLEDCFRIKFIDDAIKKYGRKELAKYLNIKKLDTITRWKKAKIIRGKKWITPQGIPLDKLKILSDLVNINLGDIEKYVIIEMIITRMTFEKIDISLFSKKDSTSNEMIKHDI